MAEMHALMRRPVLRVHEHGLPVQAALHLCGGEQQVGHRHVPPQVTALSCMHSSLVQSALAVEASAHALAIQVVLGGPKCKAQPLDNS